MIGRVCGLEQSSATGAFHLMLLLCPPQTSENGTQKHGSMYTRYQRLVFKALMGRLWSWQEQESQTGNVAEELKEPSGTKPCRVTGFRDRRFGV